MKTPDATSSAPPFATPALVRDLYRELYLAERARREGIRGSIAVPTAAISFTVFALGTLAQSIRLEHLGHWSTLAMLLFGGLAVLCLILAALFVIWVEWVFVYHEPPDIRAVTEAEARLRERSVGMDDPERYVCEQIDRMLVGSIHLAYIRYLAGNEESNRRRTWAMRFVLLALLNVAFGTVALPFHAALGG